MAIRTIQQLYTDLTSLISSNGGGKITALDVRTFLTNKLDTLISFLDNKVDKATGKQLSTEDYTTTEKQKLAGVAANANNYVHPSSHPASMIVTSSSARFVSDTEKAAWNAKLATTGGTVTGDIAIIKNNAWLSLDSASSGSDTVEQAAGISIGESGYKGGAALHLTYTGDGWSNIGMGTVANGVPQYNVLRMNYLSNRANFLGQVGVASGLYTQNIHIGSDQGKYLSANGQLLSWITSNGLFNVGAIDTNWMYMETDRPRFYFNKAVETQGDLYSRANVIAAGGSVQINKNGTASTISFPAQTNDPGYIQHIENNNAAEMRFSVSDDNAGDYFLFGSSFNGWTEAFRIHTNGDVTAKGNITAYSDARLKENVEPYLGGLDKVMSLKPVNYNRIDTGKLESGFIAQDVQEVDPALVVKNNDEQETLSLDYSRIVVMLTKAVQEQQKQIEELKELHKKGN